MKVIWSWIGDHCYVHVLSVNGYTYIVMHQCLLSTFPWLWVGDSTICDKFTLNWITDLELIRKKCVDSTKVILYLRHCMFQGNSRYVLTQVHGSDPLKHEWLHQVSVCIYMSAQMYTCCAHVCIKISSKNASKIIIVCVHLQKPHTHCNCAWLNCLAVDGRFPVTKLTSYQYSIAIMITVPEYN